MHLFGEVAVFAHARGFDGATEMQLAPLSTHLGSSQCRCQRTRFSAQGIGAVSDRVDLLMQLALPGSALLFEVPDAAGELFQTAADQDGGITDRLSNLMPMTRTRYDKRARDAAAHERQQCKKDGASDAHAMTMAAATDSF